MKSTDREIAEILRKKRDESKEVRESEQERVAYKSRIFDLIEAFINKQPVHRLHIQLIESLTELCQTKLHKKSETLLNNRIRGLIMNKMYKTCSVPSEFVRESKEVVVEALHSLIEMTIKSSRDSIERKMNQATTALSISFVLKNVNSVRKEKEIVEAVNREMECLLNDFIRKNSLVSITCMESVIVRNPLILMNQIPLIEKYLTRSKEKESEEGMRKVKNYKKIELLQLMNRLIQNGPIFKTEMKNENWSVIECCLSSVYRWVQFIQESE